MEGGACANHFRCGQARESVCVCGAVCFEKPCVDMAVIGAFGEVKGDGHVFLFPASLAQRQSRKMSTECVSLTQ